MKRLYIFAAALLISTGTLADTVNGQFVRRYNAQMQDINPDGSFSRIPQSNVSTICVYKLRGSEIHWVFPAPDVVCPHNWFQVVAY